MLVSSYLLREYQKSALAYAAHTPLTPSEEADCSQPIRSHSFLHVTLGHSSKTKSPIITSILLKNENTTTPTVQSMYYAKVRCHYTHHKLLIYQLFTYV